MFYLESEPRGPEAALCNASTQQITEQAGRHLDTLTDIPTVISKWSSFYFKDHIMEKVVIQLLFWSLGESVVCAQQLVTPNLNY